MRKAIFLGVLCATLVLLASSCDLILGKGWKAKQYNLPDNPFDKVSVYVYDLSEQMDYDIKWDLHLSNPTWATYLSTDLYAKSDLETADAKGDYLSYENAYGPDSSTVAGIVVSSTSFGPVASPFYANLNLGTYNIDSTGIFDNSGTNTETYSLPRTLYGPQGKSQTSGIFAAYTASAYYPDAGVGSAMKQFHLNIASDGMDLDGNIKLGLIEHPAGVFDNSTQVRADFYSSNSDFIGSYFLSDTEEASLAAGNVIYIVPPDADKTAFPASSSAEWTVYLYSAIDNYPNDDERVVYLTYSNEDLSVEATTYPIPSSNIVSGRSLATGKYVSKFQGGTPINNVKVSSLRPRTKR